MTIMDFYLTTKLIKPNCNICINGLEFSHINDIPFHMRKEEIDTAMILDKGKSLFITTVE